MKTRFAVWSGQVLLVALVGCGGDTGNGHGVPGTVTGGSGPGAGGKATVSGGAGAASSSAGTGTAGATASGGTTAAAGGASAGGTTATGGTGSGGTPAATGGTVSSTPDVDEQGMALLPQAGNPINTAIDNYKNYLPGTPEGDKMWGDIVVSWQFTTGAYPKSGFDHEYKLGIATEEQRAAAQGSGAPGITGRRNLGTFDNGSTITELASLGHTYKTFKDPKHQVAAQKTMDWILSAQGSTGGWPQWYPTRSEAYSGHATFNDEAMLRVMIALQKAVRKQDPFDSDIFTEEQLKQSAAAVTKGVEYILKAQIMMDGKPTVWCAQHNMQTYVPEKAREYELPSKSGQESALVAAFLMSRHQTPEIAKAVEGAVSWYNNPEVYVADKKYVRPTVKDGSSPYVDAPGQKMWYRFYELATNRGYFSDRDGVPVFDIQQIGEERYTGYVWAGAWAQNLLTYAATVGVVK